MKFKLNVNSIYELGKRDNQEDNMYPVHGTATNDERLFIVCDGMGGHDSGEVASSTVCEVLSKNILSKSEPEGSFTDAILTESLNVVYDELDKKDTGARKKMGTTMTFLKFHADGCTMAHIGDSRIYHVRGSNILFVTSDHSLVNDFVKAELITPEQAKNHPQRNVITRAIQPLMETRSKPDIAHTKDIQAGDYFFLCTDGINESLEDEDIAAILANEEWSDEEKVSRLIQGTENSRDNHSAYLIHVLEVEEDATEQLSEERDFVEGVTVIKAIVEERPEEKSEKVVSQRPKELRTSGKWWIVLLLIVIVLVVFLLSRKRESSSLEIRDDVKTEMVEQPVNEELLGNGDENSGIGNQ